MNILTALISSLLVLPYAVNGDCSAGSYRHDKAPWRPGCPGFRICEEGHHCDGIDKFACPAGVYGNQRGLQSSDCSGLCPGGHFCPVQSISGTSNKCGNSSFYCPVGSKHPKPIPDGYFGIGETSEVFHDIEICPKGFYCKDGLKYACPAGYYGDSEGLHTSTCSGICKAGFFCPTATTNSYSHACTKSPLTYCPAGSSHPIPTTIGHYVVNLQSDLAGGFTSEKPCPRGSFCIDGVRHLCPGGRFGSSMESINKSCDGECLAGWYCPEGSIARNQVACGNTSVFCPPGSSAPTHVSTGFYTVGSNEDYSTTNRSENYLTSTRTAQKECDVGHYCLADGVRRVCPAGRYGSSIGLSSPECSGVCEQGYYCPEASTSPRQYQCGADSVYCPLGSREPQPVAIGYYTVGGGIATHFAERRCEPGHYCQNGKKYFCTAGRYGDQFGQVHENCTDMCAAGYYCPEGSTSPYEVQCGEPSRYCPTGSKRPIQVDEGYYTVGGNLSTRVSQVRSTRGHFAIGGLDYICPAGRYGIRNGESDPLCTGICSKGFYCPAGSVSPIMYPCGGDDRICPTGSVSPIKVQEGFYTTNQWEEGCKPGTWRNFSISVDPFVPGNSFIPTEKLDPPCELCPDGTYKSTRGDDFGQCLPCPLADSVSADDRTVCVCTRAPSGLPLLDSEVLHFNLTTGECQVVVVDELPYIVRGIGWSLNTSVTRYEEFECKAGHYCLDGVQYPCPDGRYGELTRETNPQCTGVCPEGYYCPRGTSYRRTNICGRSDLYCPVGSVQPTFVPKGYYSTGSDSELTRFGITICPPGMYCQQGKTFSCPRGRYSDDEGTTDPLCKGECDPGYYCLEGSSTARQYECGNATVYCPRGSFEPRSVHNGFYCDLTGDSKGADRYWGGQDLTTCSVELPCEPGSYCSNGDRRLCPPGRFGWRYGLNTSECSGLCAAGYYCPSYLEPQPEAPEWTVWPRTPQLTAFPYKCGHVGWFCPAGSWYPQKVQGGYYSIGGDLDNTTRKGEEKCLPGNYCLDGIIQPCPKGRYGNEYGLSDAACSGYCPPGFYCPQGTSDPIPCPAFTYSSGGSWTCNICPGSHDENRPLPCQDSRTCCFRG
mmetsp:Transcript_3555/g.5536  ORF Transcript_3555/g.5536 Transcript_3555/m.5536 type:complete len:1103 (+) Transcript_3555:128-3436(+)